MLRSILTPLDGSELSENILEVVSRLMTRSDTEVILLHILPEAIEGSPRDTLTASEAVHEYLEAVQGRLTGSGIRARYEIRIGDPAEEILSVAGKFDPSLITMSTHGRGGLDRWIRGSVAERVLCRSGHPLLLCNPSVKASWEEGSAPGFRRILVPLDGSSFSAKVLPLVEVIAQTYGAQVILYRAVPLTPSISPENLSKPAELSLKPNRKLLESSDIPTRVRVDVGPPATGIFEAIDAERADLVVMATHGRSGVSRWAFGSVAGKVLRNCPVPLLAVRPDVGLAQE